jgi:carbon-monoxide dehydrogenase large subunit
VPDNVSNVFESGDRTAVEAAFARAAHVVTRRYVVTRVHAQYMEPRGALGIYDPGEGRYTLHADVQYPHRVRQVLAGSVFHIPEPRIRVVAGDIGGAFGTKGWQYPEHRLVLWAARQLGRAVKWRCERREAILADEHARDVVSEAALALDADGRFLGLRVQTVANVGAYVSSDRNLLATFMNIATVVGVYTIPTAHVHVTCVLANVNPTAPYRGAGRPESTYVIERLIDDAARELGRDRVALRRLNLIPPSAMPYRTALKVTYDSGQFERGMDKALQLADVAGFPARREASRRRGRLRGLGIVNAIERAASPQPEFAEIRFDAGGGATLLMGRRARGRATRPPSSRCSTSDSGSIPRRSVTSMATPIRSRSARAPSAHGRWRSAARRCGSRPTRSWRRAGESPRISWRPRRPTSCSRRVGFASPEPIAA